MRLLIIFLSLLIFLLTINVGAFIISDDYRFFLKKLKYNEDIVYDDIQVDDSERYQISPEGSSLSEDGDVILWVTKIEQESDFFDILSGDTDITIADTQENLPELFRDEQWVKQAFEEKFILTEELLPEKLYGISDEYPDMYREYSNVHMSLYMFSTKSYNDVKNILRVISGEENFSLNEVDNFWSSSLYLNMGEWNEDWMVRILFEYENMAFWLKIKKDSYNTAKQILESLDS